MVNLKKIKAALSLIYDDDRVYKFKKLIFFYLHKFVLIISNFILLELNIPIIF